MKKITELTKEQEEKIPEFVKKWIDIGLSTTDTDYNAVLEAVPQFYKEGGLEAPQTVVFVESIDEAFLVPYILENFEIFNSNVDAKVYAKVYDKVYAKVYDKVDDKVYDKVRAKNIWSSRVGASLWSGYNSWRDFMGFIGVDISELQPIFILSQHSCYLFPFKELLIVVEKPKRLTFNAMGDLHHESDYALEWRDGSGQYLLNGVRMCGAEWFFDKSILDEEKSKKIISHQNVEQRAEMARVFGYSKLYQHLDKKILHIGKDGYELWGLDLGTGRHEEFLKMVNPSTGEIHVECVVKGVKTTDEALKFRWPKRMLDKYKYSEARARA